MCLLVCWLGREAATHDDLIRGALLAQIPFVDMPTRCRDLLQTPAGQALPLAMMKSATPYGQLPAFIDESPRTDRIAQVVSVWQVFRLVCIMFKHKFDSNMRMGMCLSMPQRETTVDQICILYTRLVFGSCFGGTNELSSSSQMWRDALYFF